MQLVSNRPLVFGSARQTVMQWGLLLLPLVYVLWGCPLLLHQHTQPLPSLPPTPAPTAEGFMFPLSPFQCHLGREASDSHQVISVFMTVMHNPITSLLRWGVASQHVYLNMMIALTFSNVQLIHSWGQEARLSGPPGLFVIGGLDQLSTLALCSLGISMLQLSAATL